jgi:hypothetical protein
MMGVGGGGKGVNWFDWLDEDVNETSEEEEDEVDETAADLLWLAGDSCSSGLRLLSSSSMFSFMFYI